LTPVNKTRVAFELLKTLKEMAAWLGLENIEVIDKGDLAKELTKDL